MSEHKVTVSWQRTTDSFGIKEYNRSHQWDFDHGNVVRASAAPAYQGDTDCVDPEQAFVASIASCHMLTFLAIASQKGFVVDDYVDEAFGVLGKNEQGRMAVSEVTLVPQVRFAPGKAPDQETFEQLNHQAHQFCFIANSVNSKVHLNAAIIQ